MSSITVLLEKPFPMEDTLNLESLLTQAAEADVTGLRQFLTQNPELPLLATGSGGASRQ